VIDPIRSGRSVLLTAGMAAVLTLLGGCRQDMQDQPKMISQRGTAFTGFPDGRSARPQVANTVARGQLRENAYFYTGVVPGANGYREELDEMPFPVTMQVLERGQERYNIYCTPCHSRVGNGAGMIVQRGYKSAGNFHDSVRRSQKLGHYFYVMTNGYGAMPDYSAQLTPEDRWAVAAYIRALQLSQDATEKDVPAGVQIENLTDIAEQLGYPASFAGPWELPPTAVHALAPDKAQGMPAMAPASPTPPPLVVQAPGSAAPAKTKTTANPAGGKQPQGTK
jgi:mono/diheme cytochrome c family protein